MPWNKSTYPPAFNGLSPPKRDKAISIAESIRKECINKGGDEKSCAAKAIRIALWRIKGSEPMKQKILAEITHLSEIKKNFDDNVRGIDIVIDVNHDRNSKAAGWIRALDVGPSSTASNKQALFAIPEWTPYGKELIKNGEYRYISSEFGSYADAENRKEFKDVLFAVTLTNRPFVKGMAPVNLESKRIEILREGDYLHPQYGEMAIKADEPNQMNILHKVWESLNAFFSESGARDGDGRSPDEGDMLLAIKTDGGESYTASDYLYVPDSTKPSTWKLRIKEYVDGKKKITAAQLGRAAAALSSKGFMGNRVQLPVVARTAAKAKLRKLYKQIGKEPPTNLEEVNMDAEKEKQIIDLLAAHGVELEEDGDIIAALTDFLAGTDEKLSDLEEQLQAQAEIPEEEKAQLEEIETERTKLQEDNIKLSERITALEQSLKDKERDVFFNRMLSEGKLRPADLDIYKKLYAADEENTIALLSEGPVVVDLEEHGSASGLVEDEDDSLLKKVIKLAEEKGISRDAALDLLADMESDE